MADLVLIAVMVGITAVLALYIRWCDRIAAPAVPHTPEPLTGDSAAESDEIAPTDRVTA